MSRAALAAALVFAAAPAQGLAQAPKPTEKIDPVAVVGCLKEGAGGTWMLVNASDPIPSTANAPTPKELAELDTPGRNELQLIGASIFNLPAHRNHWLVVKGLPIKAAPVSRLNVTSVTMKAESCPPPPPPKIG
jgi:hypothetical protein